MPKVDHKVTLLASQMLSNLWANPADVPIILVTLLPFQKRRETDSKLMTRRHSKSTAVGIQALQQILCPGTVDLFLSTRQESWKIASDEIHAAGTRLRHHTDQSSILGIGPHGSPQGARLMRGIARPDAQKFGGGSQTASSRSWSSSISIYPFGSVRRKIMALDLHHAVFTIRMLGA